MQMALEGNKLMLQRVTLSKQTAFMTQTLNQGSDFVKGPDFHFLNAGKTQLRSTKLG
jgi:hypothetical protein